MRLALILVLGLVFATGLGLGAHFIARDTVAQPVSRIEAGDRLAPVQMTTSQQTATRAGTTTQRSTTTTAMGRATATTRTEVETDEDNSGRGRGRGRGRGGNSGSGGGGSDSDD